MRMAHLHPEQKVVVMTPKHHEIHLREEEAAELTGELMKLLPTPGTFGAVKTEETFPLLYKILTLLLNRNADAYTPSRSLPAKVTYSYPTGRSTTLAEVAGANKEIAKGESVRWEPLSFGGSLHPSRSGR